MRRRRRLADDLLVRGGVERLPLRFGSEFPDATVVRLEDNYRSTDPIVTLANRLMRGRPGALTLRAAASDSTAAAPAPTVSQHPDDAAESAAVAESIARRIADGASPESIAVLFRINTQSIALEAALRRAGIPVQTRANSRYFDQPEVRQAIMLLRGAAISIGDEPLFKSVSDVLRGLGWRQDPPEGGAPSAPDGRASPLCSVSPRRRPPARPSPISCASCSVAPSSSTPPRARP